MLLNLIERVRQGLDKAQELEFIGCYNHYPHLSFPWVIKIGPQIWYLADKQAMAFVDGMTMGSIGAARLLEVELDDARSFAEEHELDLGMLLEWLALRLQAMKMTVECQTFAEFMGIPAS